MFKLLNLTPGSSFMYSLVGKDIISLKQPLRIRCSHLISNNLISNNFTQSGAWGCFDEFNRINIEVLSVVAQQILSILQALGMELKRFMFEGREINLHKAVGIFITMNPGILLYVCVIMCDCTYIMGG